VDREAARFLVRGRVQGVGYRYFVVREAQALGIDGYVRNLPDGAVEVVAHASAQALAGLAERLSEGPAFAEVTEVERTSVRAPFASGFVIR
jgi:acylphosphatase